ncbi:hypothetical protein ABIC35_000480 [Sphingomonas trueperi]
MMYERWTGRSKPMKLGGTLMSPDLGYALCCHYAPSSPSPKTR